MPPSVSPTPVIILGAGGHAKVVAELLWAGGRYVPIGYLDADPTPRSVLGLGVIGSDNKLAEIRKTGVAHAFIALGDNKRRLAALARVTRNGYELVNAISPAATISPSAKLGHGIAVMAGAVINAETAIADLAIINTNASVDHDGRIGEAAHICPGCSLAGRVTIGKLAFIGTSSSAIPGITVGDNSVVGAGSSIVRNIPANSVAYGVPARIVRVHEEPGI